MAHITSFKIVGLAGKIEEYGQHLDRHVNIFFGNNGSGKTSLLKIFHCAFSDDSSALVEVPFKRATVSFYSIDHDCIYTRTIDAVEARPSNISEESNPTSAIRSALRLNRNPEPANKWITDRLLPQNSIGYFNHQYLPVSRLYF